MKIECSRVDTLGKERGKKKERKVKEWGEIKKKKGEGKRGERRIKNGGGREQRGRGIGKREREGEEELTLC